MSKFILSDVFETKNETKNNWKIVYCPTSRTRYNPEFLDDIGRSLEETGLTYVGKLDLNINTCVNKKILSNKSLFIMKDKYDVYYVWQVGKRLKTIQGIEMPDLYFVKQVGFFIE